MKIPLSNLHLYILFVLAKEVCLYPQQILKQVKQEMGKKVSQPTLYRQLEKMREAGLIDEQERVYKKNYMLTNKGWQVFQAEIERLAKIVEKAKRLLKEQGK